MIIRKGCLARTVSDTCCMRLEIPVRLHEPAYVPVSRQTVYQMRPIFKPRGTLVFVGVMTLKND